tara:strand:+ start:148 stop:495 length:348 start_codon:yes stop_codon:yes gene_type:complete
MNTVVKNVVVTVKEFVLGNSITKSRNVRGRLTSIMDELLLANEQIQLEKKSKEDKWEAEVIALKLKAEKLQAKLDLLDNNVEGKNAKMSSDAKGLSDEEKLNLNLHSGLKKLMIG